MPPMPPRIRLFFSSMILIPLFAAAIPLFTELTQRRDIWWTPRTMLVPLSQSADRVEIYVRGKPLATVVESGDVGLRFNNWDRRRAERLPLQLVRASACGAMVCLFLLLLTGRLVYRGERQA